MRQHRNPHELAIMLRRRKEAIQTSAFSFSKEHFAAQPLNRWRKRHPFDCGNPQCGVCHSEPKGRPRESEDLGAQLVDAYSDDLRLLSDE